MAEVVSSSAEGFAATDVAASALGADLAPVLAGLWTDAGATAWGSVSWSVGDAAVWLCSSAAVELMVSLAGAAGSVLTVLNHPQLNHQMMVEQGILGDEAGELLRGFFRERR